MSGKAYKRSSEEPPQRYPNPQATPKLKRKDPSVPGYAGSSKSPPGPPVDGSHVETVQEPIGVRLKRYLYNKQKGTFCDRTCTSWIQIIAYGIMYLIFLSTYTLMLLYISLVIIKNSDRTPSTLAEFLVYSPKTIGLTATPLAEHEYPLIWYRNGEPEDFKKYVSALDELITERKAERADFVSGLGPCNKSPYGYGSQPCVILRLNKQRYWAGKPLTLDSVQAKKAPLEVQKWIQADSKKYWIYCAGDQNYDKEHIGEIKYYPYPPGIDSSLFPLDMKSSTPLIAIQLSNYTVGVSLAVECKMWYADGVAVVAFMFYVSPQSQIFRMNDTQLK